jgi:hypothetical protein
MKQLSKDWLTENRIDFEYKQYILLAYLEGVNEQFQQHMLYPSMAELISHYRNLKQLRENTDSLYHSFRQNIADIDVEKFKISYQKVVKNDELMEELTQIIDFSLPQFEVYLRRGKEVYEYIEEHVMLEAIGLTPLNTNVGYLMLNVFEPREIRVYEYSVSLFEDAGEPFRGLHTTFVDSFTRGIINTPESLKIDLIRRNTKLPNPAAYLFTADFQIPFDQTYFPIAKRMLMKQLSSGSV